MGRRRLRLDKIFGLFYWKERCREKQVQLYKRLSTSFLRNGIAPHTPLSAKMPEIQNIVFLMIRVQGESFPIKSCVENFNNFLSGTVQTPKISVFFD